MCLLCKPEAVSDHHTLDDSQLHSNDCKLISAADIWRARLSSPPLLQAAAALRRLDSAGSSDSSTSGAAGAASTGRGGGSPVMDPRDVQAVAAAMLLLREGENPGADPSTARGEVWGPHAGPAVGQTGSDLSSIYSQVGALRIWAVFCGACFVLHSNQLEGGSAVCARPRQQQCVAC